VYCCELWCTLPLEIIVPWHLQAVIKHCSQETSICSYRSTRLSLYLHVKIRVEKVKDLLCCDGMFCRFLRTDSLNCSAKPRNNGRSNLQTDEGSLVTCFLIYMTMSSWICNVIRELWVSSPGRDWEFFSSPPRPDRLWGPPSLLSNGYQVLFPWG
jgi:hypothetical protein